MRFSYYGMTALLVLYLVNQLLWPGHVAMTFDRTFLLALLLLIMGSVFLKGNISAQIGASWVRWSP